MWRGYRELLIPDAALAAVKAPMIVLVGSEDRNAQRVPALVKAHPHIRSVIVPGAQHGGPLGVMRRTEFMSALREFLAEAR